MNNKKRILNVGYGKVALVAEYYKGFMSSRHFYGSIELEKSGKYDIINISLDSRQNLKGHIHNNVMMLKKSDIIFIPYLFVAPFFILAILKHLKIKKKRIIAICHTTMKQGNGIISKFLYKMIYDTIDIVFFHSQKNMEESINNKSIKPSHARFLYWGDDLEYIDNMYPCLTMEDFFISTGRAKRDYQIIVSAFSNNNIPLEIYTNKINYDTHYDYLDEIIGKYKNIKVQYLERTNNSTVKLAKRTSECLCVVIPIIKDDINYCVGLTSLIEAMAMSKPVICTYNPYSPIDIEKEGIGLVVDENRTWEQAINYIYNHREEAKKMGQKGRKLAEELFNIKKCTEQIKEAINDA